MCASAPEIPTTPERQATKLPDAGASVTKDDRKRLRKALFAGLTGAPDGVLGSPSVARPNLG